MSAGELHNLQFSRIYVVTQYSRMTWAKGVGVPLTEEVRGAKRDHSVHLAVCGDVYGIEVAQDRVQWRTVVVTVADLELYKELLQSCHPL
jgi:hypothetical protein